MSRSEDLLGPKSDAVRGAQSLLLAKHRRERGQFLAEGPQAVQAGIAAGIVKHLYVIPDLYDEYAKSKVERIYQVTDAGLKALSDTSTPAGVVAVATIPTTSLESIPNDAKVLVAVEISDPGNLGTMIRTAAAAGYDYVLTTSGSADLWSGKVVRSTAGMFTQVGLISNLKAESILEFLTATQIPAIATSGYADLLATSEAARDLLAGPHFLLVGNEAHGLPSEILNSAIGIKLPMAEGVESLNAAVAAAICMYAHKF